jgi:ribosome maturation factor RimP
MRQTPLERKIAEITDPVIEDLGFAPFLVKQTSDSGMPILQIMAEDPATKRLGVDDCAKISKAVSAVLDVEDPIDGKYRLEVSSPGIDRFLVRVSDYEDYEGYEAKIETDTPAENGQRKFRGRIVGVKDDTVTLNMDQGEAEIAIPTIVKAKLVLTDELIKKTANS